ncbi:hypothetical protein ANCCEY_02733 [Ancylostoma ceylanicum]|uniref:G-protein coupled receptors family 1 profile domain-containing protein n=1 Tax=Ancylostoma ceylanicum TaxID=53326 RepID=A0A0D6M6Y0_9BILA|nr:hypothetical protein ANCCEY_02733 [Ancylostoma ceylanicum]
MAANFSHVCLTEKQQMMNGTPLEYNLQRYVYPAIALFGILGNVLNLTVLLNKSMRSRCVIAVCGDRLVGIRSPLYARSTWSWWHHYKLPLHTECNTTVAH